MKHGAMHANSLCARLLWCAFCLLPHRKPGCITSPAGRIYHNGQRTAVLPRLLHLDELLGGSLHPLTRLTRSCQLASVDIYDLLYDKCALCGKYGYAIRHTAGFDMVSDRDQQSLKAANG